MFNGVVNMTLALKNQKKNNFKVGNKDTKAVCQLCSKPPLETLYNTIDFNQG